MARKDEVRVSDNIVKYMKYLGSYEDGRYICYQFEDESSNVALHYQVRPELLEDKKQIALARLFNTKVSKLNIGDIAVVICKAREIHEEQYDNSVFYLNVDRVLKPLTRTKLVVRDYRGVPTEFAVDEVIRDWDEIK